jgi:hypothetical protein
VTAVAIGDHWWGCAAALEARIRTLLPAGWRVTQSKDLAGILDQAQQVDTVHLVPLGTAGVESQVRGSFSTVTQRWALVFAVAAAGDLTGARQRDRAGPIIPAVLKELMGWSPGAGWGPLTLSVAPGADVATEAFAYYPFAFEVSAVLGA